MAGYSFRTTGSLTKRAAMSSQNDCRRVKVEIALGIFICRGFVSRFNRDADFPFPIHLSERHVDHALIDYALTQGSTAVRTSISPDPVGTPSSVRMVRSRRSLHTG